MTSSLRNLAYGAGFLACTMAASTFASGIAGDGADRSAARNEQTHRAEVLSGAVGGPRAKELVSNASREYPASCLSYPLPTTPSGTAYAKTVTLYATNASGGSSTEDVTITVWRVPCSSSGATLRYNTDGGPVAATLMRIQRQTSLENTTAFYPTFPGVRVAQGSIAFDNPSFTDYVRAPAEPNTVSADTAIDLPVIASATFVLEAYPPAPNGTTFGFFDFNNPFTIRFDNFIGAPGPTRQFSTSVPAYAPTAATYPAAFTPLPISGYMSGAWYEPSHGGEGILTEVIENADGKTRIVAITWYTFDASGRPFWLSGAGTINIGDTQATNIPITYRTGGGFASNFTAPIPNPSWGTFSVNFPSCSKMTFGYNGGTAINGPAGIGGPVTWTRLGNINGLTCE